MTKKEKIDIIFSPGRVTVSVLDDENLIQVCSFIRMTEFDKQRLNNSKITSSLERFIDIKQEFDCTHGSENTVNGLNWKHLNQINIHAPLDQNDVIHSVLFKSTVYDRKKENVSFIQNVSLWQQSEFSQARPEIILGKSVVPNVTDYALKLFPEILSGIRRPQPLHCVVCLTIGKKYVAHCKANWKHKIICVCLRLNTKYSCNYYTYFLCLVRQKIHECTKFPKV